MSWICPKCNAENADYVIEGVKKTKCLCGYDLLSNNSDPAKPSKEDTSKKTIFKKTEYTSFMFGVFILGGILVVPWLWGFGVLLTYIGLRYIYIFPLSLILCVFIFIAFRRNGTISWIRAIPTGLIVFIIVPPFIMDLTKRTIPPVSDVILGFAILILCGRLGVIFTRLIRRKQNEY